MISLITKQDLVDNCGLVIHVDDSQINPKIDQAHSDVKKILGADLLNDLAVNPTTIDNRDLLALVKPLVSYWAYSRYLPFINSNPSASGLNMIQGENYRPISSATISLMVKETNDYADVLKSELLAFLNEYKAKYPLWKPINTKHRRGIKFGKIAKATGSSKSYTSPTQVPIVQSRVNGSFDIVIDTVMELNERLIVRDSLNVLVEPVVELNPSLTLKDSIDIVIDTHIEAEGTVVQLDSFDIIISPVVEIEPQVTIRDGFDIVIDSVMQLEAEAFLPGIYLDGVNDYTIHENRPMTIGETLSTTVKWLGNGSSFWHILNVGVLAVPTSGSNGFTLWADGRSGANVLRLKNYSNTVWTSPSGTFGVGDVLEVSYKLVDASNFHVIIKVNGSEIVNNTYLLYTQVGPQDSACKIILGAGNNGYGNAVFYNTNFDPGDLMGGALPAKSSDGINWTT